ncbi:invasion associated locus B family protein [Methylocystis silviterrae]|uniref:invasion associated locus B family protein n=1 Tax=Methylocystis silviterrae TaxID=2743612 RepID=UPI003C71D3D2
MATIRAGNVLNIVLLAVLAISFVSLAHGQGSVKSKLGAWEHRCDTPTGSTVEHCVLSQTVIAEEAPKVALGVIIIKRKEEKSGVLQVIAPISVLLPKGVSLKIDQADIGRIGFLRCFPAGCLAEVIIDENLFQQFSNGKIATLVIYIRPYEGLRHLLPLQGFKEGYEMLR